MPIKVGNQVLKTWYIEINESTSIDMKSKNEKVSKGKMPRRKTKSSLSFEPFNQMILIFNLSLFAHQIRTEFNSVFILFIKKTPKMNHSI